MSTRTEATIDDLSRVPENGKAEIVNGELVLMSSTGGLPGRAADELYVSLHDYEKRRGGGYAFPDNVGFIVNFPHRRSFSPDAAFYKGELRGGLFLEGAPIFAVEVRRSDDYGPRAELAMAQSALTISQPERWLCGTSTCCAKRSCGYFARSIQRIQLFTTLVK